MTKNAGDVQGHMKRIQWIHLGVRPNGDLRISWEMVGDEKISMDIFRDSGDLLVTSP